MVKILTASFAMTLFAGCAVPELKLPEIPDLKKGIETLQKATNRAEYTGTDKVGAVDSSKFIGTWKYENVNSTELEKEVDSQFTFKQDGSFSLIMEADLEGSIGKFVYDITGTWSVDDEYVTITPVTMKETSGNALAAGGAEEVFDKEGSAANVHEASANYLVIYDEEGGVAQSFTRLN